MDLPQKPVSNPSSELEHVMQEMYKKNLELNEKNNTLALLRKIDEIVLSSVTDLNQVSQQVSDLLIKEEFKLVSLFMIKNSLLVPLAISSSENSGVVNMHGRDRFLHFPISAMEKDNLLVRSVNDKKIFITSQLSEVIGKSFLKSEAELIQLEIGIKSVIVYPLIVRNDLIGVLIIGIDNEQDSVPPERKRLIDRLAGVVGIALDNSLLYISIQEANEKLKQLDKLKDEFVSLASHELRTPMTIIKSYLWMLLNKNKETRDPKEKVYMERAYESTQRLINLVNDMLNVSRIESGRLKLEMVDLQIVDLIEKNVTELIPRAEQLGLKLSLVKPSTIASMVHADPERIEQVLINLIGNSLKFTPKGGFIKVIITLEEKNILVQVIDSGKGLSPEGLKKLFQKFGTMGGSYLHKDEGQGTGLGLYLSKSLIELEGGKIWAQSEGEGKGAIFNFTLPYTVKV